MKAIYLASIDANSGKRAVGVINSAIKSNKTNGVRIISRSTDCSSYHFFTGAEVTVRFEDSYAEVELSGDEDRVMATKSKLLKIVEGLRLS